MTRRAIPINECDGYYDFPLGATPVNYSEVRKETNYVRVVEPLMGWAPWEWAVQTERGFYFVEGDARPREFGAMPEEEED